MKRLAEIVEALESGELDLERSLSMFEEGVRLSRMAEERLRGAQQRVEQLVGFDAQGKPRTAELDEAESPEGARRAARAGADPCLHESPRARRGARCGSARTSPAPGTRAMRTTMGLDHVSPRARARGPMPLRHVPC